MAINNNSFTTSTNIQFGSTALENTWWNCQTFEIPTISFEGPQLNTRSGALIKMASDTVTYDDLSIDLILDKEFKTYDEIYAHFLKRLNVETGQFLKYDQFDLWFQLFDGAGKIIKKFWFYNCRLTSFGGASYNTTTDEDENPTLTMTFTYDYFEYDNTFFKERYGELN